MSAEHEYWVAVRVPGTVTLRCLATSEKEAKAQARRYVNGHLDERVEASSDYVFDGPPRVTSVTDMGATA